MNTYMSDHLSTKNTLRTINRNGLPLLISVPHGGYSIPSDLRKISNLEFKDIFTDSDPYTRDIYSFQDETLYYHDTDIARAVIDCNRGPDDMPPDNPDGVIKSHTIEGKAVYMENSQPNCGLTRELLEKYYFPYHWAIDEDLKDSRLICAFDCHTMLEYAPVMYSDKAEQRPYICLSNYGDEKGNGPKNQLSCPPDLLHFFAECLRDQFPEEADEIVLNTPFKGGYISQNHSTHVPWIQIELNRRAYLSPPWFNKSTFAVDRRRIAHLRRRFLRAFTTFCNEVEKIDYLPDMSEVRYHPSPRFVLN